MSGTAQDDPRREQALAMPIAEVADRLGLDLKRATTTEREGPCPSCGGRDRFAINTAKGVFGCRVCQAGGDCIALVRLALGCGFRDALTWLVGDVDLALDPVEAERRREHAARERARREAYEARARENAIRDAVGIWERAEGHDVAPVAAYLAARGVRFPSWPMTLRCLPDHPYRRKVKGESREWHRGPCMIAAVWAPDRSLRAVHQTWIDPARPGHKATIPGPDGGPLPSKLVRGSKKGGAIRLTPFPPDGGCLIVGEGIETTGSTMMADPVPGAAYWAGVDLGNMAGRMAKEPGRKWSGLPDLADGEAWLPPPTIGRLIFLQDGDSAPDATRAKLLCGLRRAQAAVPGLRAQIVSAPEGKDFNDMIRGEAEDDTPEG